jgi:hypothetical protein
MLIDIPLTLLSMFTEMSASVYECARFTGPQNRPRNLRYGSQPK